MNLELARFNMIEQQIRPWDVLDPLVLETLANIRRERFVPPAHAALAFTDVQIPLLDGAPGACMLEPKVEARLLQELKLQGFESVLEIGSGSGFMAALLALRAAEVTTLEIHPALAEMARQNLADSGLGGRVKVQQADGSAPEALAGHSFDAIVLSGSVQTVPEFLLQALKQGGRLVAVVGDEPIMRARLFTRTEGGVRQTDLFDTVAPRLQGFKQASRFVF
jgi:protein-L-isoaspartate(D-aspartate) O-methyltransferase